METIVNDQNFSQVLESSNIVMVDFWAPWCGPCRSIAPIVAEVAEEYSGKVVVAKCNVDESEEIPFKYGIRNIPTIIYFKNGEPVEKSVGAVTKSQIVQTLNTLI